MSVDLKMDLPVSIVDHRASAMLAIEWEDGVVSRVPHAVLREWCRCASCVYARRGGQNLKQRASGVMLTEIKPVADKGLNLVFSDGHDRGIFPWQYLRELAEGKTDGCD